MHSGQNSLHYVSKVSENYYQVGINQCQSLKSTIKKLDSFLLQIILVAVEGGNLTLTQLDARKLGDYLLGN